MDGVSLMPLITDHAPTWPRKFARSVFPRCYTALDTNSTEHLPRLDRYATHTTTATTDVVTTTIAATTNTNSACVVAGPPLTIL